MKFEVLTAMLLGRDTVSLDEKIPTFRKIFFFTFIFKDNQTTKK